MGKRGWTGHGGHGRNKRVSGGTGGGLAEFRTGMRGVLLSCDVGRERNTVKDVRDWIAEIADDLWPRDAVDDDGIDDGDGDGDGDGEVGDDDVVVTTEAEGEESCRNDFDDDLRREVTDLKKTRDALASGDRSCGHRVWARDLGVKGLAFVEVDDALEPARLVQACLERVKNGQFDRCQHLMRLTPVETSCVAKMDALQGALMRALSEPLHGGPEWNDLFCRRSSLREARTAAVLEEQNTRESVINGTATNPSVVNQDNGDGLLPKIGGTGVMLVPRENSRSLWSQGSNGDRPSGGFGADGTVPLDATPEEALLYTYPLKVENEVSTKGFFTLFKRRYNEFISKVAVENMVKKVATLDGTLKHVCDYSNADESIGVVVEIFKNTACVGIVRNYNSLRKYNVRELKQANMEIENNVPRSGINHSINRVGNSILESAGATVPSSNDSNDLGFRLF